MNIEDFIARFNDIIPYTMELIIGGIKKDKFIKDKSAVSRENFKGKKYPFYNKTIGEEIYIPAHECTLPIEIKVKGEKVKKYTFDAPYTCKFEKLPKNSIKETNKQWTDHKVRIFDERGIQIGFITLTLNKSGDIREKTCFYENEANTHNIHHSVSFDMQDGDVKTKKTEMIEYKEKDLEDDIETKLAVYRADDIVYSVTVSKKMLKTSKGISYHSITDFTSELRDSNLFINRVEFPSVEDALNISCYLGYEGWIIWDDFIKYSKEKALYDRFRKSSKIHPNMLYGVENLKIYLDNPLNNLLCGFTGDYIGHTFIKNDDTSSIVLHTVQDDLKFYTEINVTGTDPFKGGIDEAKDEAYLDAVRYSSRIPKFVTKVVDGKEVLVSYNGVVTNINDEEQEYFVEVTDELQQEFREFQNMSLQPFEEAKKSSIGKLLKNKK